MYLEEFMIIALYHLMAVASPGPDFAVTIRYSLSYGRRIGRWVSLGIGTGILLHVAYSVLGIALVIHRYQWVYASLLLLGAGYLGWLGSQAIRSAPKGELEPGSAPAAGEFSAGKAFRIGFFTNGLNVKATLFFLVLFSTVIAPETPTSIKIGYGLYMAVATAVWFAGLATLINWPPLFRRLWRISHWIDRVMGVALLALSLKLIVDWLRLIEVLA
ncbi:lysine transporter LysE [Pseudidiomarina salinarum]|uniref:Lysine transporter LysE n=1 Tax=Pseudidiomarina salinarum TaxID=435908 RepID=A0A094J1H2_9GAMM|nr:LysE family transporter [Pseudidiomarina salinarum]KFZ31869.1 lysine transporter LysE [Pseudidiomarina salinarum]RUO70359.1 lysine transporter LysE [Pseudidiomarina salinarum]